MIVDHDEARMFDNYHRGIKQSKNTLHPRKLDTFDVALCAVDMASRGSSNADTKIERRDVAMASAIIILAQNWKPLQSSVGTSGCKDLSLCTPGLHFSCAKILGSEICGLIRLSIGVCGFTLTYPCELVRSNAVLLRQFELRSCEIWHRGLWEGVFVFSKNGGTGNDDKRQISVSKSSSLIIFSATWILRGI